MHKTLILPLFGWLLAGGFASAGEPFQMASLDEVEKMLASKDVAVYDANPEEVYAKHHLPGARFVASDFGAKSLPQDKGTRLVFYCANPH